jgi:hypothetical protein
MLMAAIELRSHSTPRQLFAKALFFGQRDLQWATREAVPQIRRLIVGNGLAASVITFIGASFEPSGSSTFLSGSALITFILFIR